MTVSTMHYQNVLHTIYQWPAPTRVALIKDLLNTLASVDDSAAIFPAAEDGSERSTQPTLQRALGLLDTGGTPPSDADIENWLAERHLEKHGS